MRRKGGSHVAEQDENSTAAAGHRPHRLSGIIVSAFSSRCIVRKDGDCFVEFGSPAERAVYFAGANTDTSTCIVVGTGTENELQAVGCGGCRRADQPAFPISARYRSLRIAIPSRLHHSTCKNTACRKPSRPRSQMYIQELRMERHKTHGATRNTSQNFKLQQS